MDSLTWIRGLHDRAHGIYGYIGSRRVEPYANTDHSQLLNSAGRSGRYSETEDMGDVALENLPLLHGKILADYGCENFVVVFKLFAGVPSTCLKGRRNIRSFLPGSTLFACHWDAAECNRLVELLSLEQ